MVDYLRWALPDDAAWFAIPNGEWRALRTATQLKDEGVRAGVPDLLVLWRGRTIFIELKIPGGRLSAVQQAMHALLRLAGADVYVCRTLNDVATALESYQIPLRPRLEAAE